MIDLHHLLAPRSIAVLGGSVASRVVEQCLQLGFEGPIWPVHPTRTEVAGVRCLPSLEALPSVPDATFIGVNRHATVQAVRELAAMGAHGAVCYGSGFAEAGDVALQDQLLEAAGGMPVLGPNCFGYINTFDRIALWPDEHGCRRTDRGAAIISQSGNVAVNLTFQQRGLRLGTMISVGNQASIGTEDCIQALLDDDRITAIGLFLEAVRDAQRFADAALRAARQGVPIVALHTGRSAAGSAIAASHTGSMAGHAAAYDAMFERYGVATVRTPAELVETLKLLDHGGPLRGPKVVSLSCSGGEASLVADLAEAGPLVFEPFAEEHRARVERTLTELVTVSNPFDYHTFMWGDRTAMAGCFTAVLDGPHDVTMLVLDAPPTPESDPAPWHIAADALADAADCTGRRAVVVATLSECINEPFREHLLARGLTPLLGLGEALAALEAATVLGRPLAADVVAHAAVIETGATRVLHEADAKAWLREVGVAVPAGSVVASADDLAVTAAAIGYPVTLKTLGAAHKSESGGVRVGLVDDIELAAAAAAMNATPLGYLVEATVTDVVAEVLVTVRRDHPIGWLVTVGFGGVQTELWRDVCHLLAPVTNTEVVAALGRLRSAALLTGFRGRPGADVAALADMIVRLTDATVGSDVVEIELNPVLVGRHGAIAVDALMIVVDHSPHTGADSP